MGAESSFIVITLNIRVLETCSSSERKQSMNIHLKWLEKWHFICRVEISFAYVLVSASFLKSHADLKHLPSCDGRISRNCISWLTRGWGSWMELARHVKHGCFCSIVCDFRSIFGITGNSRGIYWRPLTHLMPRGLVLQIISSSVDCFFSRNYFENNHSSSPAGLRGQPLELPLSSRFVCDYLEKDRASLYVAQASLIVQLLSENHCSPPPVTLLSHPLWVCVCFFVCTVYTIWRVCVSLLCFL